MITINSNGVAISSDYNTAVKEDTRTFLAKIYKNNIEIDCGVKRLVIDKGSCGSSTEFTVGNLISSTLTAELLNLNDNLKGEEVEIRIGLLINGDYEYITMGFFTINTVKRTVYSSTITGHGRIVAKTSGEFTEPAVDKTLARVGSQIGIEMGCQVIFDSLIDTSKVITAPMNGLTTYQALQVLTSVVGGYAIDTNDGNVKICVFQNTGTLSVDAGMMTSLPDTEEQNFLIKGVRCIVSEASADGDGEIPAVGYERGVVNLVMKNSYMTSDLFDQMATALINYSYRPATINLSLGDPRIEGNDVLNVEDVNGSIYAVPCHILRHIYDGGFRTEIESVKATNENDDIGTKTPFQKLLSGLESGVVAAKTIAQKAKTIAGNTAQYFWFTSTGTDTGVHITEKPQEEFLADPTNGGGNLLARSNGIAVRDGLTELSKFSRDGIQIGLDDTGHVNIEPYNFELRHGDLSYFQVKNLTGELVLTTTLVGRNGETLYYVGAMIDSVQSVTIDGTATTRYSIVGANITIDSPSLTGGEEIVVVWTPKSTDIAPLFIYGELIDPMTGQPISLDTMGVGAFIAGDNCRAKGPYAHAEGSITEANGEVSHSEGYETKAEHFAAHAEGYISDAKGAYSHAEGHNTLASGESSHAEGEGTQATALASHAEGRNTKATGPYAHAEGNASRAENSFAHAEGNYCVASGMYSHAGGAGSQSTQPYTFAHGQNVTADGSHQAVFGKFNILNTGALFVIGNGSSTSARSDALELSSNGNLKIAGTLTQSSDRRLKEHIKDLDEDAVEFIRELRPVEFKKNGEPHLGFYAQEVEEADKWRCLTDEMNGFKTLSYIDLIAPLVSYCQHLEKRIEELERGK